ncbi:hypothetical protein BDN70DRAFT_989801 [Pholiota conissans]|uniref:Uncharacterized protein n=1 Tax=Pholiota conissans TaxID=109636 RepID=A0A9P5ZC43_9AGAR|nr:hypothetical protein BDN70DRAFT_989801 [Pholiota conissans]
MLQSDTAQLVGLFVESIFYGIYLVTFGYCLQALFRKPYGWKHSSEINFASVFVALSLFFVGTINLALAFYRIQDVQQFAFNTTASVAEYVGQPWVNIVKEATMNFQVLIADGALTYRCWEVYGRRWKFVLLPIVLWLGALADTVCVLWANSRFLHSSDIGSNLQHLMGLTWTIFWVTTIVLNVYATGMIVIRICRVNNINCPSAHCESIGFERHANKKPTKFKEVIRIVIDSGLIYTTTSLVVVISLVTASTSYFITTSADMIVIGIAFNLINIRVAKARARDAITPSVTETKAPAILEFNHDLSLAVHQSQPSVNSLSGVHVEMSDTHLAKTIV